jgi:hypothetical protein
MCGVSAEEWPSHDDDMGIADVADDVVKAFCRRHDFLSIVASEDEA